MWEQIQTNRRRSMILVLLLAGMLLGVGYGLGVTWFPNGGPAGLLIAFGVWLVMCLVSYYQGGKILLALSGAREIQRDDLPQLYHVVEEMKIASGMPALPRIFVMDDPSPNAFATGRDLNHSAVAVTSGLLKLLNRDELQGVIAHEMAHIKNRDILLMLLAGVLLGSIVILADLGRRSLFYGGGRRSRSSGSGGGQAQAILLVVSLLLMILAPLLAQLIYLAISRRREYLADATGTQFTRYPEGLAAALEKLAASTLPLEKANRATAPMFIVNPFSSGGRAAAASLTSTHPPIEERIRILRAMGGGASFVDYDRAFRDITRRASGIIPSGSLQAAPAVPVKTPAPATGTTPSPTTKFDPASSPLAARAVQDAIWKAHDYRMVDCACGARLKIPPSLLSSQPLIKCPRCGKIHELGEGG